MVFTTFASGLTAMNEEDVDGQNKERVNGDSSQEIKRRLLLGRKVMTNLDRIFKSRDITLPTKVHLVRAMFFPVVMYGCEHLDHKES